MKSITVSSTIFCKYSSCDTSVCRDTSPIFPSASLDVEDDDDFSWNGSSVDGGGDVVDAVLWLSGGLMLNVN